MLDIDGFRIDKSTQATVDALANFTESLRECARNNGKENFFIAGEITGGNNFGSIYLGRGREPDQKISDLVDAVKTSNESDDKLFLRAAGKSALDASAFHYSVYRQLQRFLGMDGNLTVGYDISPNPVDGWNQMLLTNDLVNPNTGKFDPRHMYGQYTFDIHIKQSTLFSYIMVRDIKSRRLPLAGYQEWDAENAAWSVHDHSTYARRTTSQLG